VLETNDGLYAAFKAKDTRFDGRFFVGVSSTGIYCRPVCRAKQPKAENCTFYRTAAEAEQAGYRPCLLCRPELAPGSSRNDSGPNLLYRAARMLEENCATGQSLEETARQLGCTGRHLRRVFKAEYNVPPVQYLQTCRLLLAKSLLTDTRLSVLEAALTAGFGSLRRFNHLCKKHYKLSPTRLRKQAMEGKKPDGAVTLALGYRPPYVWAAILDFLKERAISGVEAVRDGEYFRTAHFISSQGKPIYGWLGVGNNPAENTLAVTISESLLPVLPQVLARVKHLFDLRCDPEAIHETLQVMNELRSGLCLLGTRVPGCFNAFETAVRAVLGQQITVKAAVTLAARLANAYGAPVLTGIEGLTHVSPSPRDILALQASTANRLGALGVTAARAKTIYELTQAIVQGKIEFGLCARPEEKIKKLTAIRGIGSWTAQYIAMRALEWPDAFLETDAGVKKALPSYSSRELLALAEAWRPWRSYAVVNLWNSL
jgi:AraC family transcriptional regulator of adaptative response / DNA-3-methyladenine glycosylase II